MIECYQDCSEDIQPVVSIYPGFLNLRLFDKLYKEALINTENEELTDAERIIAILSTEGPKSVKKLQEALNYNNRGHFLKNVLNPMLEEGVVYRDGKPKSPYAQIKINIIRVNSDFQNNNKSEFVIASLIQKSR